ncbi:unnamed protein product [Polarella glacialis]|uniref:Uncharacterized protein n=1 Tax=Polarella glacialis TaxID=89957 RepID=A0A813KWD7_POLGL|nr:unnamed protein product [Polarella glacialis]
MARSLAAVLPAPEENPSLEAKLGESRESFCECWRRIGRRLASIHGPPGEWLMRTCLHPWGVAVAALCASALIGAPLLDEGLSNKARAAGLAGVCGSILLAASMIWLEGKWPRWWLKELGFVGLGLAMNALAAFLASQAVDRADRARHLSRLVTYKLWPLAGLRAETTSLFLVTSWLIDCAAHYLSSVEFGDPWDSTTPFWLLLCMLAFGLIMSVAMRSQNRCYFAECDSEAEARLCRCLGGMLGDFVLRLDSDGTVISCDDAFSKLMRRSVVGSGFQALILEGEGHEGSSMFKVGLETATVDHGVQLQLVLQRFGAEDLSVELIIVRKVLEAYPRESSFLVAIKQCETLCPERWPSLVAPMKSRSDKPVGKVTSSCFFSDCIRDDDPRTLTQLGIKEHWIIEKENLCMEPSSMLGAGGFGIVMEGEYNGTRVAVKIPKSDSKIEFPLLNELRLLRHLRHPNIVLFFGACIGAKASDMMLVFELIHGITLRDFMAGVSGGGMATSSFTPRSNSGVAFTEQLGDDLPILPGKLSILSGIACALQYLHSVNTPIVHTDLKDSNVFVETWVDHLRSKLGDFGISRLAYKVDSRMGGTLRWMAPEIITSSGSVSPAASADVFSFGRMMSMILSGVRPCQGFQRQDIFRATRDGRLPPLVWPSDTQGMKKLCEFGKSCVVIDPLQRPTMRTANEQIGRFQTLLRISSGASVGALDGGLGVSRLKLNLYEEVEVLRYKAFNYPTPSITFGNVVARFARLACWFQRVLFEQKALAMLITLANASLVCRLECLWQGFNTVISACARAGEVWLQALALLRALLWRKLQPTVMSYGSAISACAQFGRWQLALSLLVCLKERGVQSSLAAVNAAVSACGASRGSSLWQVALALGMPRLSSVDALRPDAVTWGAAVAACASSEAWESGLALLESAETGVVLPSLAAYGSGIAGCGRALRWEAAVGGRFLGVDGGGVDDEDADEVQELCAVPIRDQYSWHFDQPVHRSVSSEFGIPVAEEQRDAFSLWAAESSELAVDEPLKVTSQEVPMGNQDSQVENPFPTAGSGEPMMLAGLRLQGLIALQLQQCQECTNVEVPTQPMIMLSLSEVLADRLGPSQLGVGQETCEAACFSVGSVGHPFSCHAPCKFFSRKKVCKDGSSCSHCHACRYFRRHPKHALDAQVVSHGELMI